MGFNNNFESHKDNKFSYFKAPVRNTKPLKKITLDEVHRLIISDDFKQVTNELRNIKDDAKKKDLKASNFDYVTFNGVFTERNDKGLKIPSNFFTVDIDHVGENLSLLKEKLKVDKVICPQLIFVSPGGDGLKVVIKINSELIDYAATSKKMGTIWQSINKYFSIEYAELITPNGNNDFIDGACKDISRACFLCHDAAAYINVNDVFIDADFVEKYNVLQQDKKATTQKNDKTVSPKTSLEDLAARHLKATENHHGELLAFVGAAKTTGMPKDHVLNYIKEKVQISQQSSHNDFDSLNRLIDDVYSRYSTDSEGVKVLTPLAIGFSILYFTYSTTAKKFVLTSLLQDEVLKVLHDAGFCKRNMGKNTFVYIQKKGCVMVEVTPQIMRDYMTNYVNEIKDSVCFSYKNLYYQIPPQSIRETYLRNGNNIFNEKWLEHLQVNTDPFLKDTENEIYFSFKNGIVTVSKEGAKFETWDDKNGISIWDEQLIKHDFDFVEDFTTSHFYSFIRNVTNKDDSRLNTMFTGIGYLLHYYFKESEGQAVIFYDESITDTRTPMGGSGKGLIVNAIKQMRNVVKIDGKHLDISNKFKWELLTPSTQVAWLDDVKPDFDFSILHSNLTDGWTVERKHFSQFIIDAKDSPKTVICSNSILKGGGSTNKRRQFVIELSDYYSRQIKRGDEKPIEQTHGGIFFSNSWNKNEWNMFFTFMIECVIDYLNKGLICNDGVNIELNRFRQSTSEDFAEWIEQQDFQLNIKYPTKEYFERFVNIYYGNTHQIGQRTFTAWLKDYATFKKWILQRIESNGTTNFMFQSS
jgi:hypothetical protein